MNLYMILIFLEIRVLFYCGNSIGELNFLYKIRIEIIGCINFFFF